MQQHKAKFGIILTIAMAIALPTMGCHSAPVHCPPEFTCNNYLPRELDMVSLPAYVIAPPDELIIDAVRVVPLPPYWIEPLDTLAIRVPVPLEDQPIGGLYPVSPEGNVDLGFTYGSVDVGGLTTDEAEAAILKHLQAHEEIQGLIDPIETVSVSLAESRALQQIRGPHLVRPDGTIGLGVYGSVRVSGMTIAEARVAIEEHLSFYLKEPEISIDVSGFNSQVYYVISDGAGYGEQVASFPITGNERVLDALAQIGGVPAVGSKKNIWIARPAPCELGHDQMIPVDWKGIAEGASTVTNFQLMPGDRVYVKSDKLIRIDNALAKFIAPMERIFGFTLLGNQTVQSLRTPGFGRSGSGF